MEVVRLGSVCRVQFCTKIDRSKVSVVEIVSKRVFAESTFMEDRVFELIFVSVFVFAFLSVCVLFMYTTTHMRMRFICACTYIIPLMRMRGRYTVCNGGHIYQCVGKQFQECVCVCVNESLSIKSSS